MLPVRKVDRERTFAADKIEDYVASPTSLMSARFESLLSVEWFRDSTAFLNLSFKAQGDQSSKSNAQYEDKQEKFQGMLHA